MINSHHFTYTPKGPFDLLHQNQYFNGWPVIDEGQKLVMAFPVEGWRGSAAVTLRQSHSGELEGEVFGPSEIWKKAQEQALAAMSLDEDASEWPKVGEQDPFIGQLQETYKYMRPTLFHSPYEAAAAFMIGHRISIHQARKLRQQMAEESGESIIVNGQPFYAFPSPSQLLKITEFKGLNDTKIERLHGIAQAALDGWLDRDYLRALDEEAAIQKLETLPGVGPFFSQGILYRGAGLKDGFTHDDVTHHAIQMTYHLPKDVTAEALVAVTDPWRPYRMWVVVLMHVWLRASGKLPKRTYNPKV